METKSRTKKGNGSKDQATLLEEYFIDELRDIYWAEKHLVKAIPKLQKAATTAELKQALGNHVEVTQEHISRLEEVFNLLNKKAQGKKCEGIEGITKEGEQVVKETETGSMTRDVAIIMAAQKAEHYEIASYGGLVQLAKTIGKNDIAEILATTLEEEKETDQELTSIAENDVNIQAQEEPTH